MAQREVELKLEVSPRSAERLLHHPSVRRHAEGEPSVRRLHSVYFDTVDLSLRQTGLSLRIRKVDDLRIQTLKADERTRGALYQRNEDEVVLDSDRPDPQAVSEPRLRDVLQRTLSGRSLRPLFETDMQRSELAMQDGRDRWRFDLDVGEIRAAGRSEPICELELELLRGEPVRLYDAALELVGVVELTVGLRSKALRGYALARRERTPLPLREELVRLRESLGRQGAEARERFAPELERLEEQALRAQRPEDLQRLLWSEPFVRVALQLGRLAVVR